MSDRLKQIWSGFENETTRNLTGSGIDNIHVPHRREWRARDDNFLPEGFEAPAERAFAALNWKLNAEHEKHTRKKRKGKSVDAFMYTGDGQEHLPETRRYAPGYPGARLGGGEGGADDQQQSMAAALKATDFRVLRREINYMAGEASSTERALKNRPRKKKFLGIF